MTAIRLATAALVIAQQHRFRDVLAALPPLPDREIRFLYTLWRRHWGERRSVGPKRGER